MDQFTRRIVGFAVHPGVVDGMAPCRMFNRAIHGQTLPKYLSSDHDPLYQFHQWQANLRILEVKEIKTVPYVPLSHPFVERLIGTIRREYLDQTLFWTAADLEEKLGAFQNYFNRHRTHSGLEGRLPQSGETPSTSNFASYRWQRHCRDFIKRPSLRDFRNSPSTRRKALIRPHNEVDRQRFKTHTSPSLGNLTRPTKATLNYSSMGLLISRGHHHYRPAVCGMAQLSPACTARLGGVKPEEEL